MHFPEQQLMAYLRVFLTQERADDILNDVATTALAADVQRPIEFFCLAHWLMDEDEHRSVVAEVVALVDEAGLLITEAAIVLDRPVHEIDEAHRRALAETGDHDSPTQTAASAPPGDTSTDTEVGSADGARVLSSPTHWQNPAPAWRAGALMAAAAAVVVAVGALAFVMLSPAGRVRLLAQGVNPMAGWVVLVVLIIGGAVLIGVMNAANQAVYAQKPDP